jgi:glycosyltransferase involved in cell wall biosynthesis
VGEAPLFISVVVPVRNEERYLRECLASLLSQRFEARRYEVIVVDGESTDRTRQIVAEFAAGRPNLRLVANPGRIVSCGRNVGIGEARGEVVAFVEGHAWVETDFLTVIEEAFGDPRVLCLGRSVEQCLPGDSAVQQATGLLRKSRLGRNPHSLRFSAGEVSFVDPASVATVYRREVFARAGLFDESLTTNEDVELNWRVRAAGIMALRTPGLRYFLHPRDSLRGFLRQMFRYGYGKALLVRLHRRAFRAAYAAPTMVLAAALAGALIPAARLALVPLSLYLLLATAGALYGGRYLGLRLLLSLLMVTGFGAGFACGLVGPRAMARPGRGRSPAVTPRRERSSP